MVLIPTEEWGDLKSPGLVFFQTYSQEFLQMEYITDESKENIPRNKRNAKIMYVGDTILAAS